jgi:subtilisin family serine protease
MARSTKGRTRQRRLERLQFEGLALQLAGAPRDRDARMADARRVVREAGLDWRVALIAERARTVLLVPRPGGRAPSPARAWEITHRLRAHRDVVFAEPAFVLPGDGQGVRRGAVKVEACDQAGGEGTDDCRWALEACNVLSAWSLAPAHGGAAFGQGVRIAHPDTGWTAHPELANTSVDAANAYDFVADQPGALDPLDPPSAGHGTSTASVIASDANVSAGPCVTGVAPLATLMPLRVSSSVVHFSWLRLTAALWHALAHQAHVVSMSLGGPLPSFALEEAIAAAVDANLILVAAAGNHWPFVVYPARYDPVIACAAIDVDGERWHGSASGPAVDVAAPGAGVWRACATKLGFAVGRSSGTSYAAAHVAGVAALWLAHHGRANLVAKYGRGGVPSVFKELLAGTAASGPAWPDDVLGAGIVDAAALLAAPLPARPHAAGMHVRTGRRSTTLNPFDRVAAYFPSVDPDRVRAFLAGAFGVPSADVPARLATLGDEVLFHLTADPATYATVARSLARRSARSALPETARLWFRGASPTLRRALD